MAQVKQVKVQLLKSSKKQEVLIATVTLVMGLTHLMQLSALPFGAYNNGLSRRSDDDDELDSRASVHSGNQDGPNNGDGYEEADNDGPYEETPRDEEGQADLERFFDDHLGASEKDGMDKENLPTNLMPMFVMSPEDLRIFGRLQKHGNPSVVVTSTRPTRHLTDYQPVASSPQLNYLDRQSHHELPTDAQIETRYMRLPNNKLIITRQIISDSDHHPDHPQYFQNLSQLPSPVRIEQDQCQQPCRADNKQQETLEPKASDVVATEDDDLDRVYVTKLINRPFKIPDLGGYDPEEDFKDASRDIMNSGAKNQVGQSSNRRSTNTNRRARNSKEPEVQQKDISFNDPDADDILFNDASETDEVTFGQDPYQEPDNLEEDLKRGSNEAGEDADQSRDSPPESSQQSETSLRPSKHHQRDDSDTDWVNDGVDDMDIPSQTHQDEVLDKAAKREAELARRNDEANGADQEEPGTQRMPNADYLKEDMPMDDQDDLNIDDDRLDDGAL